MLLNKKWPSCPGVLSTCGGGENTMRLNFSNATPEMITEGIRRLGALLHEKTRNLVKG